MRALVITNMYPSKRHPARGSFVRDQVDALRRCPGVEVELFAFEPGLGNYPRAGMELRRRYRDVAFDVVHAHFGLTAWPSLAISGPRRVLTLHGNDLHHPRSRKITAAALPLVDLPAAVSASFASMVPGTARRVAILPCGVETRRFRPLDRRSARLRLGLDPERPYLLFPHDPERGVKRYELARAVAGDVELLTLGAVAPEDVPLWINAANAVLIPSDWESFGLGVLEALACDVPVLATPTGIAPLALAGIEGTLSASWDLQAWRPLVAAAVGTPDPRVAGRARAELFSADRMARRVVLAWEALVRGA